MSKNAAHERRMTLLYRARRGRVLIHCEGGIALKNRDLQRLVRDGYLVIGRSPGIPKWSKRFKQLTAPGRHFHGTEAIRRSFAKLTPKGEALLRDGTK